MQNQSPYFQQLSEGIKFFCVAIGFLVVVTFVSCENNKNEVADIELDTTYIKIFEADTIIASNNSSGKFDIDKDGVDDFVFTMSFNTKRLPDCDPVGVNSCQPWDEYIVTIQSLNNCLVADTTNIRIAKALELPPTDFDNYNWNVKSLYLIFAPYLPVCDGYWCSNTIGYLPIKIGEGDNFRNGWIEVEIEQSEKIIIKRYGLEITTRIQM